MNDPIVSAAADIPATQPMAPAGEFYPDDAGGIRAKGFVASLRFRRPRSATLPVRATPLASPRSPAGQKSENPKPIRPHENSPTSRPRIHVSGTPLRGIRLVSNSHELASQPLVVEQVILDPNTNVPSVVGCPMTEHGLNDPTFLPLAFREFSAIVSVDAGAGGFWLRNAFTGATTSPVFSNDPLPESISSPTWQTGSGHPNYFLALPSARINNTFCLKSNAGFAFPVQKSPRLTLPVSDGMGGSILVTYEVFNVWAQIPQNAYYGTSFRLYDLTTGEAAPEDVLNLADPTVEWTPQTGGLPTAEVVIILPEAEAGNPFVLHTSANTQLQQIAGPVTIAGVLKKAVVQGLVGLGNTFWLVRGDGVSSPAFAVAQSGSEVDLTQAAYFPEGYLPAWAQTRFRFGVQFLGGHLFRVLHANGIVVEFTLPLDPTGYLVSTNSAGEPTYASYADVYAAVDRKQGWVLWNMTTGENLGQVTSVQFAPGQWHAEVPAGKISVNIPRSRRFGYLKLKQNGVESPVEFDLNYPYPYAVEAAGYWQDGTSRFSISYHPALADGDPSQPYSLVDGDEEFDCGAGVRSPAEWYRAPEPLSFTINASRWEHELYLRHFDGSQFPIVRNSLLGNWYQSGANPAVFTGFGVFSGLALRTPDLNYFVYDRTLNEISAADTTVLGGWGTDNTDTDQDGLANWYEMQIGTIPTLQDTDGDGVCDGPGVNGIADYFPLDPTRSSWGANPSDHTPPVLTLTAPSGTPLTP